MGAKSNFPIRALALLALPALSLTFSNAYGQAITITDLSRSLAFEAVAGSNSAPYTNLVVTNSGAYSNSRTNGASDPMGISAAGLANQSSLVMMQSNILYVTGSAGASNSANYGAASTNYYAYDFADTQISVQFSVSTNCGFTLQANTTYGAPYSVGPPAHPEEYYPRASVELDGGSTDFTYGEFNHVPPTDPASGQVSGTLTPGSYTLVAEATGIVTADPTDGYPASATQTGSLTFSLTVYPPTIPTNRPTLKINYAGTNLILSWPIAYPNYVLVSNANAASTNWTAVATPPSIVSNLWEVTNGAPAGTRFYRLMEQ